MWRIVNSARDLGGVSLGEASQLITELGGRFELPSGAGTTSGLRAIEVVFVGGNEIQARYDREIDEQLTGRYRGAARCRAVGSIPAGRANWNADAHHAESALVGADVLVLMSMLRTNLGRHMRRVASELSRPGSCALVPAASVQGAIDVCATHRRPRRRGAVIIPAVSSDEIDGSGVPAEAAPAAWPRSLSPSRSSYSFRSRRRRAWRQMNANTLSSTVRSCVRQRRRSSRNDRHRPRDSL